MIDDENESYQSRQAGKGSISCKNNFFRKILVSIIF
jgi:hypothetical protein